MRDKVEFGVFDPKAETAKSVRELPHWFQPGVATFITFRTADSLPESVVLRMHAEVRDWLVRRNHSVDLKSPLPRVEDLPLSLRDDYRKLKTRLWQWELDACHGECLLRRPELALIVMGALRHFDQDRYDLDRAVIMPNHVHLLVQFRPPTTCRKQCRSWLTWSARTLNAQLGRTGEFWQSEPFDHLVRSSEQFEFLQRYIEQNGPQARLKSTEYLFWKRGME